MWHLSIIHYFDNREIACQCSLFETAELRDYSTVVIADHAEHARYGYITGPAADATYHAQVKRVKNGRYQFNMVDGKTEELLMVRPVSGREPDAILAEGLVYFIENIKEFT